jgi:hypothetical protein
MLAPKKKKKKKEEGEATICSKSRPQRHWILIYLAARNFRSPVLQYHMLIMPLARHIRCSGDADYSPNNLGRTQKMHCFYLPGGPVLILKWF